MKVLDILIFAFIALFLLFRLYSVLGSRTGHEKKRPNPYEKVSSSSTDETPTNVVDLSKRRRMTENLFQKKPQVVDVPFEVTEPGVKGGQNILEKIKKHEPGFQVSNFLAGAEAAFPMILRSFATGDRGMLKSLLAPKVYDTFISEIEAREAQENKLAIDVTSLNAEIIGASLTGDKAKIEVRFESEQIHTMEFPAGKADENPQNKNQEAMLCRDLWTFERKLNTSNPNWVLIDTQEEVATEKESS